MAKKATKASSGGGKGREFNFHGAFGSKAKAEARERQLGKGAFIKPIKVRGKRRYAVLVKR